MANVPSNPTRKSATFGGDSNGGMLGAPNQAKPPVAKSASPVDKGTYSRKQTGLGPSNLPMCRTDGGSAPRK